MCAKKNLKLEILTAARQMFNEHSWANTSLRGIADEMGISDGNLRYHYKTKEDIVISLFGFMAEDMVGIINQADRGIQDLTNNFREMFAIMYRYRFLFVESYFIKKEYPAYAILFTQLQESRRMLFMDEFNRLKEEGVLSGDFDEEQYEFLFEQLFVISDSWIKYIDTDDEGEILEKIDHYARLCFGLFVPYLKN